MKKVIAIVLIFLSFSVCADPSVFGMELGKMTENELRSMFEVNHSGINKYSNGSMYSVDVSSIDFDGLEEVTTIFDPSGSLVAVLATMPKNKFDYINSTLSKKYKLVSQIIPFVGNKEVVYRDGNTEITLEAPHMSFEMSMNYVSDEFKSAYEDLSQAENIRKQEAEASQL